MKLTKIQFKQGNTLIGTAINGDFDQGTGTLKANGIGWKVAGADPLKYLQQDFDMTASTEKASDAANLKLPGRMKLVGLMANQQDGTFKG